MVWTMLMGTEVLSDPIDWPVDSRKLMVLVPFPDGESIKGEVLMPKGYLKGIAKKDYKEFIRAQLQLMTSNIMHEIDRAWRSKISKRKREDQCDD